jgi:hypothetical protein
MEIEDGATLGLQQGLIEQTFLRDMEVHGQRVTRPWRFKAFTVTEGRKYPVNVELEKVVEAEGQGHKPEVKTIMAKYLGKPQITGPATLK